MKPIFILFLAFITLGLFADATIQNEIREAVANKEFTRAQRLLADVDGEEARALLKEEIALSRFQDLKNRVALARENDQYCNAIVMLAQARKLDNMFALEISEIEASIVEELGNLEVLSPDQRAALMQTCSLYIGQNWQDWAYEYRYYLVAGAVIATTTIGLGLYLGMPALLAHFSSGASIAPKLLSGEEILSHARTLGFNGKTVTGAIGYLQKKGLDLGYSLASGAN